METRVEANIDVEMVDIETQAEITTATRRGHAHEMLF